MPPTQRDLFRLFVPLALSGIFFPLARPLINAALARTANPEQALAAFGIALSVTMPLISPLFSLRQVTTALAKDQDMRRRIRNLSLLLGSISTALLLIVSIPQVYNQTVVQWMAIPDTLTTIGPSVLLALCFSPLLGVGRGYYQGILVRYNKAGPIGTGALAYLLGIAITLFIGITWIPIEGAILAAVASVIGQIFYILCVGLPSLPIIHHQIPDRSDDILEEHRTNRHLIHFYLPLAISTGLMSIIEPALQTGMARSAQPTLSLAAYAIAVSLGWLARTPLWNAQQIVISHATDLASYYQTRKFMFTLGFAMVLFMAILGAPGISDPVFTHLMGVQGDMKQLAISGFRWLIPLIFFQALRSLYHGVLTCHNLTRHVQYASMIRTVVIFPALIAGVSFLRVEGIYIVIWANLLSELAETIWLHRAVKKIDWNKIATQKTQ